MRTKAFNRYQSYVKAKRKQQLAKDIYYDGVNHPYYNNLHQYSKNKIHCSCCMCAAKTRNKGSRRTQHANYASSINYKHSDLRKQMQLDEQLRDEGYNIPKRKMPGW